MSGADEEASDALRLIDSHCHLADDGFNEDLEELLHDARQNGVTEIIGVASNADDAGKLLELSRRYNNKEKRTEFPTVSLCIGLHPCEADLEQMEKIAEIIKGNLDSICGIGECGLDFTPRVLGNDPDGNKEIQYKVLLTQAALAKKYNLPLNVHSRSAGHHAITCLKEAGVKKAVFHAFDGKAHYAEMAANDEEVEYYFSIPPSIVRGKQTEKLVKRMPMTRLLLETDAPALGPTSNGRNTPANLLIPCQQIAWLKGITVAEVAKITSANATRLFHSQSQLYNIRA